MSMRPQGLCSSHCIDKCKDLGFTHCTSHRTCAWADHASSIHFNCPKFSGFKTLPNQRPLTPCKCRPCPHTPTPHQHPWSCMATMSGLEHMLGKRKRMHLDWIADWAH